MIDGELTKRGLAKPDANRIVACLACSDIEECCFNSAQTVRSE